MCLTIYIEKFRSKSLLVFKKSVRLFVIINAKLILLLLYARNTNDTLIHYQFARKFLKSTLY